uniref:Cytochrome P450 n=2 Tax=Timema TaxID=61471 RepID=A0A7R9AZ07_TIMSH|nr:unnamed protein product [Timema shepardi]
MDNLLEQNTGKLLSKTKPPRQMIDLGKLELSSCVLVLLAAILCYYLSDWFRAVLVVSRLPGPPGVPLLGHSLLLTDHKRLLQIGANAYQEYGSLIKIWLTVLPSVLVVAPEFIQVKWFTTL